MANIKSAKKRIRQSEKRSRRNAAVKSSVRTEAKKVLKSLGEKAADGGSAAAGAFAVFVKKIDKAASKGVVHWKTAARKKSRLAKKINAAARKPAGA